MNEPTLTHKDLARDVGVSETTIKSYRRKFPGFVPVAGYGKPIRFKPEALDVCQAIREAFNEGLSVGETERRLKEKFKQYPQPRPARDLRRSGGVSDAALEQAMEQAMERVVDRLAAKLDELVQAQNHRLDAMERALEGLGARMAEGKPAEPGADTRADTRVRAKKIVNVRSPEGHVDSYALEDEEGSDENGLAAPPPEFLSLPVVIRTEQGEFLGVPGKLEVTPFVRVLEDMGREQGAVLTKWVQAGDDWIFDLTRGDGVRLEHHFSATVTPRGNEVANLARLDVDGERTSWPTLVDYFRRIKDRL